MGRRRINTRHIGILARYFRIDPGIFVDVPAEAGMQRFLSGYAIWAGRRWRRLGHLFQGRYRAEMIEDQSNPAVA
jgi:hypothetical protein